MYRPPLTAAIGRPANAHNGDEAAPPGEQGPSSIGALDLAERAGAIPHESPSNINVRVPPPLHRRPTRRGAAPPAPNPAPKNNPLVFPPKIP